MKENLRRPILFAVIVITGSILILFDIPLTLMIPILLIVGFIILLILGAVTVAEMKTALETLKPANLKKIGIIKKLDGMKFFEKSSTDKKDKTHPVKAGAKQPVKEAGKKSSIGIHLTSFVSSIKSLGTLLKERKKRGKKVDAINEQLDKTVSEKVEKRSAPARAGNVVNTPGELPPGGAGTNTPNRTNEQDPFLSLSEDEFDTGLLDSLDDFDTQVSSPEIPDASPSAIPETTTPVINEPDTPLPPLDIDGEAGNILSDNAMGLEEFSGLDDSEEMDSDFADLDSLSLDDVDFDENTEEKSPQPTATIPAAPPVVDVALPESDKDQIKTEWVKSDAPKNADQFEEQESTQADMAAFSAGGGGGDDADLLSSLAADAKHVKVEVNLSLVRELKDFKAPATEIESELNDMYTRMNAIKNPQKKGTPPPEEIK
jgi:hypothetical protein